MTSAAALPGPKPVLKREIELDFIRGIAILMVIDFHSPKPLLFWPMLKMGWRHFGWAGVDIFFVLSGFLVGGLLVKEWKMRGSIQRKRFLVRRGFKIWPQYYAFLLISLLTGHRSLHELWGNLLNIQNYVGGIAHTWTLALEEHAYLLLVFLLAALASTKTGIRAAFGCIATLAATVVVWRFTLAAHGVNTAERTDTRIDGILYGVLLAMVYHYFPERFRRLQRLWPLCLAVIVASLLYLRFQAAAWWDPPLQFLLMDGCGAATLLLLYRHHPGNRGHGMLYRAVAWIGLYSYGIYLWHVAPMAGILAIARHLHGPLATAVVMVLPIIAAIVIGVATTKAVELPALALRDRWFPKPVDSAVGPPAITEARRP
ncbi:MAG: acyltransferase family protein [Janthinobacterium lividum]